MLECVVNLSEGRDRATLERIAAAAGPGLLDTHLDAHHNRSVLTLAGAETEEAARRISSEAVATIDLRSHTGAHPRLGAVDVVPFVPLGEAPIGDAVAARDSFASWLAASHGVPCFIYGPERSLPEVRRRAFSSLEPDVGPNRPHPSAGATAVGARLAMVAYNLWIRGQDLASARRLAASLRGPAVRALAFDLGGRVQVSFNLLDPAAVGPGEVFDAVALSAEVESAELVGLIPRAVLEAVPPSRWAQLGLDASKTIEGRLEAASAPGRPGA